MAKFDGLDEDSRYTNTLNAVGLKELQKIRRKYFLDARNVHHRSTPHHIQKRSLGPDGTRNNLGQKVYRSRLPTDSGYVADGNNPDGGYDDGQYDSTECDKKLGMDLYRR